MKTNRVVSLTLSGPKPRVPRKALEEVLEMAYLAKRIDWDRSGDEDTTEIDAAITKVCKAFRIKNPSKTR
jgi:hypothetical protein